MFRILFILFIALPIIEIMVLLEVGSLLGFWATLALVILTAWAGAKMVREQGISTLNNLQAKMAQGELPSDDIIAGLMILVSGALMLTPGFITDAFGLFLLWPKGRQILAKLVKEKVLVSRLQQGGGQFHFHSGFHSSQQSYTGNVFEHEADPQPKEQAPKVEILEGDYQRKN
jgi:UPF0716 protein FxsA